MKIKITLSILAFGVIIAYIFIIDNTINYKDTQWIKESPKLIALNSHTANFCFAVTEPATIYWRMYTEESQIPNTPHEFTNTNTINLPTHYGGNITTGNLNTYTNKISGLKPQQLYYLSAIAVPYIGDFPKEIKLISFETP
ncbi:MAG: hypothetical protein ACRCWI_03335 [Brevinema sp.]